jgi:NADH-quinone oxidoreductase subunit H
MDLKVPPSPRLHRQPLGTDGPVVGTGRRGSAPVQEDTNV